MKTKLLRRLRCEARKNTPTPAHYTYPSIYDAMIAILRYENEKNAYILCRVAELKQKRK